VNRIYDEICPITGIQEVANNIFLIQIFSKNITKCCEPGQFVNVRIDSGDFPFLRRPFSIYNTDISGGYLEILVKVVGDGTSLLSQCKKGDDIRTLGPLGNSFHFHDCNNIILAAGGIGLPPLYFLYNKIKDLNITYTFFYCARTESELIENDLLRIPDGNLIVATDDGSCGIKGILTDVLDNELNGKEIPEKTKIFGCGPEKMLEKINELSLKYNIKSEVSVERVMGCGFGVCQGCVIKVKENNMFAYKLVCKDGPVFDSTTIVWE